MRTRVDVVPPSAIDRGFLDGTSAVDHAMIDTLLEAPRPIDAAVDLGVAPDDFGVTDAETIPDGFVDDCPFKVVASHPRAAPKFDPIVDGDTVYILQSGPDGLLRTIRADDSTPVTAPGDEVFAARDGAFLFFRRAERGIPPDQSRKCEDDNGLRMRGGGSSALFVPVTSPNADSVGSANTSLWALEIPIPTGGACSAG